MLKYILGFFSYNQADGKLIESCNSDKLYAENCQIIGI